MIKGRRKIYILTFFRVEKDATGWSRDKLKDLFVGLKIENEKGMFFWKHAICLHLVLSYVLPRIWKPMFVLRKAGIPDMSHDGNIKIFSVPSHMQTYMCVHFKLLQCGNISSKFKFKKTW